MNTVSLMNPGELSSEYRVRMAEERAEADERRRIELVGVSETASPPAARIRAWERTHGLTLPRAESHPVLLSVAAATRLTLDQVREEQRRRLQPVSANVSPAVSPAEPTSPAV